MPDRSLTGRTALVTGSTSGIGLGIAEALAREGADIMLNGLGDDALIAKLKGSVAALGVRVEHNAADMAKPVDIERLVAETARTFGSLDILVNNAGIQHVAPVEDFPPERWDAVIAINLTACFHAIRHALPLMRKRGWGRIINIASAHGLVASAQKSAYVTSKHGLVGLTKVVALETATTAITCNAICPGWVLTPLVQAQIEARVAKEKISYERAKAALLGEKQPSLEFATTAQIGGLAAFLCSEAAAQIRGASLSIDGGWTAQ
jgi:3-hydroxybutyrate dehydrogenase